MFAAACIIGFLVALYVAVILAADSVGNAFMGEVVSATIGGPLSVATAPVVHLAQAPFTPGPSVTLAGITEATFDGYAAKPLTGYGTPHLLSNGTYAVDATPILAWVPSGSVTPNTIAGFVVVDHAGNMVSNGSINPPVVLAGPTTTLSIVYGFGLQPGSYTSTVLP